MSILKIRCINVYEKLFNVIMPSSWIIEMIKPIYKNKGDKFDLRNDRPITIVSCLGKLFTAIARGHGVRKEEN
jgi:hypothetical protein